MCVGSIRTKQQHKKKTKYKNKSHPLQNEIFKERRQKHKCMASTDKYVHTQFPNEVIQVNYY